MPHQFADLPNIGVLRDTVPRDIFQDLKALIDQRLATQFEGVMPYNNLLLGHMQEEWDLKEFIPRLEPYLLHLAQAYDEHYHYFEELDVQYNLDRRSPLKLTDLWVNLQRKHEFNPIHEHTGIMSFNIWVQIPYDLEAEIQHFPTISSVNRTSKFGIHYANILGQLRHYSVSIDKSWEGQMVMFPSKLNHSVNPFYTSDGLRISVAGNLRVR
jgi:hypothetical protein